LINNRLEIKQTGYQTKQKLLNGSLLDGELVMTRSNQPMYLIFDCLFLHDRDLRGLPLFKHGEIINTISTKPDKEIQSRYHAIQWVDAQLKNYIDILASNLTLQIIYKKYLFSDKTSIFKLAKTVWDKTYDYHLDGLIFTPLQDQYPIANPNPKRSVRFERLLKWKPTNQLSIDFWVIFQGKQSMMDSKTQVHYIRAKLMVHQHEKLVDFVPKRQKFEGTDPQYNVIHLVVDVENRPHSQDNNIIYDQSVVEFVYDNRQPSGFEWIPLRSRPDKTQRRMPNSYKTAGNTWSLILSPVTVEMVTTDGLGQSIMVKPPSESKEYYYSGVRTEGYLVQPMRDFHNEIKSYLITTISQHLRKDDPEKILDLLDVACGEAGDLSKWKKAKINYVLGLDNMEANLTNPERGAYTRWREHTAYYPRQVDFLCGDSSLYLNDGTAGRDTYTKSELKKIFTRRTTESFDLISCQFALHYFFKDRATLMGLLYNVAMNLKVDGYFIGTTLNGSRVFDKMKTQSVLEGKKSDQVIWRLSQRYKETNLEPLGQEILAYNINIGKEIPEYLVNFDFLEQLAKHYHLQYIAPTKVDGLQGIESFEEITKRGERLRTLMSKMSEEEKEYSFLNNYFVLQKFQSDKPLPEPPWMAPTPTPAPPPIIPAPAPAPPVIIQVKKALPAVVTVPTPAHASIPFKIKKAPPKVTPVPAPVPVQEPGKIKKTPPRIIVKGK
jgi:mRNA (guanine-N7-)-methyltransferase